MCTPWGYATPECLLYGRGLLPWEWQHFQQQHQLQFNQHHSQKHTQQDNQHAQDQQQEQPSVQDSATDKTSVVLHAEHADEPQHTDLYNQAVHTGILHHMVGIDADTGLQQAEGLEGVPMLLMDSLVHVTFPDSPSQEQQQYADLQQECLVLNNTAFTARFAPQEYSRNADSEAASAYSGAHPHRHLMRRGKLHQQTYNAI